MFVSKQSSINLLQGKSLSGFRYPGLRHEAIVKQKATIKRKISDVEYTLKCLLLYLKKLGNLHGTVGVGLGCGGPGGGPGGPG
jgi:hypothetical protein